ncbi:MAG: leucine--tRNA ligase [Candidatus Nomurabacteria bacterium]|jgi:leucyl-tRNA synthetase|nr:leucine--tRNA ligase [Candidatus Nomurabacteria bacterium]
MKRYDPSKIEAKWQKIWQNEKPYEAVDFDDARPKIYLAEMFPYPSAAGLHVGHVRNFTIVDVLTRFYGQLGYNVMRPFGYDTFGLPAENYAIKTGTAPQAVTTENIANFRNQAQRLGYAIDWSREISSSDPEYYRWTQWIFARLFERGLAYQKESDQWWCPVDKTVLANEQVEAGKCWRCGAEVEKKTMKQWFFKITAYADELLDNLDDLDWPDKIKTMQRNWIGKSVGAEIDFVIANEAKQSSGTTAGSLRVARDDGEIITRDDAIITVFTTRPDTIFGATFMVLAPEHHLVKQITTDQQRQKVNQYVEQTQKKSDIERQENKQKTGVFTGAYAINPATNEKIPIWVADYVLANYGEGAIMAVPAHDERDYEFAQKFNLPIIEVIKPQLSKTDLKNSIWTGEGIMVNSMQFDNQNSGTAREKIVKWLSKQGIGREKVNYRMRDWLISRQRYWGTPIPIAYDSKGQPHLIPDNQLPVLLPGVEDYKPDDSGRSALAKADDWPKVTIDGQEMTRETDTMDGYADSSWYLLRYADPHNTKRAFDAKKIDFWNPVDIYAGADHAVAHLLYVRFWTKFFADEGLIGFREPVKKLIYHGYVNAPDGQKMSKSKGNVIDPLDIIDNGYGADTLRTYEMFMGPMDQDVAWDIASVGGVFRFLNRIWNLTQDFIAQPNDKVDNELRRAQHKTVKKVTGDIKRLSLNTAIAALMEYLNTLAKNPKRINRENIEVLLKLLAPFAPHMANELFEQLGNKTVIDNAGWPEYDEKLTEDEQTTIAVQVNGKLRGEIKTARDASKTEVKTAALELENVQKFTDGKTIAKTIYVPNKIINLVPTD